MATSAINFGTVLHAQDNPWGLVYEQAISENVPGKVNIHPVKYNLDGIEIAANVYTPEGYNPTVSMTFTVWRTISLNIPALTLSV